MGGPRLEIVKFGVYVFFPIGVMLYFGGPDFYHHYVKDIKFWPDYNTTHQPPKTHDEVKETLVRLKLERESRWRKALESHKDSSNISQPQTNETNNP